MGFDETINTTQKIELTDTQIQTIIETYLKPGDLGKLSQAELSAKTKSLATAIADQKLRRFLLEAGFCGGQTKESMKTWILQNLTIGDIIISRSGTKRTVTSIDGSVVEVSAQRNNGEVYLQKLQKYDFLDSIGTGEIVQITSGEIANQDLSATNQPKIESFRNPESSQNRGDILQKDIGLHQSIQGNEKFYHYDLGHGTKSGSLIGIIKNGGLMPVGNLVGASNFIPPFSGELCEGITGGATSYISFARTAMDFRESNYIGYARMPSSQIDGFTLQQQCNQHYAIMNEGLKADGITYGMMEKYHKLRDLEKLLPTEFNINNQVISNYMIACESLLGSQIPNAYRNDQILQYPPLINIFHKCSNNYISFFNYNIALRRVNAYMQMSQLEKKIIDGNFPVIIMCDSSALRKSNIYPSAKVRGVNGEQFYGSKIGLDKIESIMVPLDTIDIIKQYLSIYNLSIEVLQNK